MKTYNQLKANIVLDFYLDEICKFRKVEKSDVLKKSRKREFEDIRHIAIFLAKKRFPKIKLKDISDFFNLKEHSTIVHCLTKIENLKGSDADIRRTLEYCEKLDFVSGVLGGNGLIRVSDTIFSQRFNDNLFDVYVSDEKNGNCDICFHNYFSIQNIDIFDVIIISKNINSNPLGVLINSLKN